MLAKKIIGLVIALIGIALLVFSNYIHEQVVGGQKQIDSAQQKVDQGNQLFSLTPETKQIGKNLTDSAQTKINAGQQEVDYYSQLASQLKTAGIVAIVLGSAIFIWGFFPKNATRRR